MSRAPLTEREIVEGVQLSATMPTDNAGRGAVLASQFVALAPGALAKARVWWATWPDGTSAMLFHNAAWSTPRPEQLVRAYRNARMLRDMELAS